MNDRPSTVFLERQTYRRRRLIDAARLLPIVGAFLWMLPLLWALAPHATTPTSVAMLYVFGVWLLLVLGSTTLTRWLGKIGRDDNADLG